jgi:hypothetical protein
LMGSQKSVRKPAMTYILPINTVIHNTQPLSKSKLIFNLGDF